MSKTLDSIDRKCKKIARLLSPKKKPSNIIKLKPLQNGTEKVPQESWVSSGS
jgi:hypothetical protein